MRQFLVPQKNIILIYSTAISILVAISLAQVNSAVVREDFALQVDDDNLNFTENYPNCTPPAIDEFPPDLFTDSQRRQGFLVIHFLSSAYIFYCLALICEAYFVPCIECLTEELHLPSDVAGATFMSVATSSPELFTNFIGTFVTKGDLGVGTIIGSAVFNILGVGACCGLAAKTTVPLEWYPLTRDSLFYTISVIFLIIFLGKQKIFWYEALVLVIIYCSYIFVMYKNTFFRGWVENLVVGKSQNCITEPSPRETTEKTPLLGDPTCHLGKNHEKQIGATVNEYYESSHSHESQSEDEILEESWTLINFPTESGVWNCFQWLVTWPARFVFTFTIPDCRKEKWRKFWPFTLFMCVIWIGVFSYLVSWLMTVIGHTLYVPDSVVGLTLVAAGNSLPELVSSIIVARHGLGTMSFSNAIGSNTFDILICLGLPWLIKGSMIATDPDINYIKINSAGLEYSVVTLLISVILLYTILACNRFNLDRKVGFMSLAMYCCFLVFASLFEMNVFMPVNLPTCDS